MKNKEIKKKKLVSSPSMRKQYFVAICLSVFVFHLAKYINLGAFGSGQNW